MRRYVRKRVRMQAGIGAGCVALLMIAGWAPRARHGGQAKGAKSEAAPLRLRIWTERATYRQGEKIPIHVELTNVSKHDVFIGRDLWTNASPSRVQLVVTLSDGRSVNGRGGAADGPAAGASGDYAEALLKWCALLPAGYSYGASVTLQEFVSQSELVPGVYEIGGQYTSAGVKADTSLNPLLNHPDETAKLQVADWTGQIRAKPVKIRIVARQE